MCSRLENHSLLFQQTRSEELLFFSSSIHSRVFWFSFPLVSVYRMFSWVFFFCFYKKQLDTRKSFWNVYSFRMEMRKVRLMSNNVTSFFHSFTMNELFADKSVYISTSSWRNYLVCSLDKSIWLICVYSQPWAYDTWNELLVADNFQRLTLRSQLDDNEV